MARRTTWTVDAVKALGTVTDIVTAGSILGVGRTVAYQLARDGQFPIPVIKVGERYTVPVGHLLKAIGVDL